MQLAEPYRSAMLLRYLDGLSIGPQAEPLVLVRERGHHRFDLLPQAAGELQAVRGGVTFRLTIGERTCVVLQALDREGEPDRTYFVSGPDGLLPRSFDLATGRYRVQLESRRLGGPGGSRVTPLGQPREVSVEAGRTHSLTLP